MFFDQEIALTERLRIAFYHVGTPGKPRLMLLHDNLTSAGFFEPMMKIMEPYFELAAPDLRGFGHTEPLPIDATRGLRDFSDDVAALAAYLGWDRFSLLGWGLGGGVAMQYAIDHAEQLESLILCAPTPPKGVFGSFGPEARLPELAGLGSGAGCADQRLTDCLKNGERAYILQTFVSHELAPSTEMDPEFIEFFVDCMCSTQVGEGLYPGDVEPSECFPGFCAGKRGVCNAVSSRWCDLTPLAELKTKPPILWVHGTGDSMVSDTSFQDPAFMGMLGIRPGWPGMEQYPPQPMLAQTRRLLDRYRENGGSYDEVVLVGGHCCLLDREEEFIYSIQCFMEVQLGREFGLPAGDDNG